MASLNPIKRLALWLVRDEVELRIAQERHVADYWHTQYIREAELVQNIMSSPRNSITDVGDL